LVGDPTGFNGDDVGPDRPDGECGGEPVDDVRASQVAVQQQDLDELAGAVGVTVSLASRSPERVVRTPAVRA